MDRFNGNFGALSDVISVLIILRTDPRVLEILGTCTAFALETHDRAKLYEVDTSTATPEESAARIQEFIENRPSSNVGKIDWLQQLEASNQLMEYFRN